MRREMAARHAQRRQLRRHAASATICWMASQKLQTGRIDVICGCMFSGKTTALIARLSDLRRRGMRVLAAKHTLDRRYDAWQLASHDGRHLPCRAVRTADELSAAAEGCDVVGCDEAQFFGLRLVEVCAALRARGAHVVAVGIDHDAWGRPFPPLPQLQAIADTVSVLTTPCRVCGAAARFSQRLTPVEDVAMVGGDGEYEPRCRAHFTPLPDPAPDYAQY